MDGNGNILVNFWLHIVEYRIHLYCRNRFDYTSTHDFLHMM